MTQQSTLEALQSDSRDAVSERAIKRSTLLAVSGGKLHSEGNTLAWASSVEGNGKLVPKNDRILGQFKGETGSYQIRIMHPEPFREGNGITVRYRISGWENIRYLAIGHTVSDGFRHVKISNPSQGEWVTFSFSYQDLAYQMTNDWANTPPTSINDVRVYISGTPPDSEAQIEVAWVSTWHESTEAYVRSLQHRSEPELFEALKRYFQHSNVALDAHAESFLKTGVLPMTGAVKLPWELNSPTPTTLSESGTYRYLWHAMQPAISLLVHGDIRNVPAAIYAARDYISSWLERSYFTIDLDTKYTWYDHGTAERLLAFLLMHEIGLRQGFDFRFMERLRQVIISHGQLLESEVFYCRHQLTRYHNHAWFQDIALIAAAVSMAALPCSSRWLNRAIERLNDQFRQLIVRDGPFSIFVENSIGYHHGVQRLGDFASELVQISATESEIPQTAQELNAWSDFLRYPDNRSPSQGDTVRKPNPVKPGERITPGNVYTQPSTTVLPAAGYAVVKGNHDEAPFMLCMFATSLSTTHKHEDDLSITLFFDGIEWLIDPSFYSHDYTEEIPRFLRSARAHNRVVVDKLAYAITPGSTRLLPPSDDGVITGQSHAYDGVRLTRSIKCRHDSLLIEARESVSSNGPTGPIYLLFHCGEGVSASVSEDQLTLSHPLSHYLMLIDLPADTKVSIIHGRSEGDTFHGIAGTGFMQYTPTSLIRVETQSRDFSWQLRPSLAAMTKTPLPGSPRSDKKLIIHAGLPKTGSTSVQDLLSRNRSVLLSQGILYPRDSQPGLTKHAGFVNALLTGNVDELERWLSFDCLTCIISNESISNAFYHTSQESFRAFRNICKTHQITPSIILVDRDKDEWLHSYYQQCILNQPSEKFDYYSTSLTLEEFSEHPYVRKLMDRDRILHDLEKQLGGNVEKLTYNNEIVPELLNIFGVDLHLAHSNLGVHSNQSIPSDLVELIRSMNATISRKEEKYFWMRVTAETFEEGRNNPVISALANRCSDIQAYSFARTKMLHLYNHVAHTAPGNLKAEISDRLVAIKSNLSEC